MRLLIVILLAFSAVGEGQQLLNTKPTQKIVPVEDNSGLIMDIYKQTNAQNAQLSSMTAQMGDIKESVNRIEAAEQKSDSDLANIRHDVDKCMIANLFVYGVQTFFTILVAVCVTVPGTFFVQKVLGERFAKLSTPPTTSA